MHQRAFDLFAIWPYIMAKWLRLVMAMRTAGSAEFKPAIRELSVLELVRTMLGGPSVLPRAVDNEVDVHDLVLKGLPIRAMLRLVDDLHILETSIVLIVLGMSPRNFQRRKAAAQRNSRATLSAEEGSKLWKFAEILALATRTLGSQEAAEIWLNSSQMGLEWKRPVDLLATIQGAKLVDTLLTRMEYGVYT
jgi:putative toxin-antitoxin system antitoxin component (TIGR02293 family)